MIDFPYRRLLVTGAAGFIGSHLVDRLLAADVEVIAVDNFDPFYAPSLKRSNIEHHNENRKYKLVSVDIRDRNHLLDLFSQFQPDAVVHLAAKAGVRPSVEGSCARLPVN